MYISDLRTKSYKVLLPEQYVFVYVQMPSEKISFFFFFADQSAIFDACEKELFKAKII